MDLAIAEAWQEAKKKADDAAAPHDERLRLATERQLDTYQGWKLFRKGSLRRLRKLEKRIADIKEKIKSDFTRAANEIVKDFTETVPEMAALHAKMEKDKPLRDAFNNLRKMVDEIAKLCDYAANQIIFYDSETHYKRTIRKRVDDSILKIRNEIASMNNATDALISAPLTSPAMEAKIADDWHNCYKEIEAPAVSLPALQLHLTDDMEYLRLRLDLISNIRHHVSRFTNELKQVQDKLNADYNKMLEEKRKLLMAKATDSVEQPTGRQVADFIKKMPATALRI